MGKLIIRKLFCLLLIAAWLGATAAFYYNWAMVLIEGVKTLDLAFFGEGVLLWVFFSWLIGIAYCLVDKIVCHNYGEIPGQGGALYRINFFRLFENVHEFKDVLVIFIIVLFYPLLLVYITLYMVLLFFLALFKMPCPVHKALDTEFFRIILDAQLPICVYSHVHYNGRKAKLLLHIVGDNIDGSDLWDQLSDVLIQIMKEKGYKFKDLTGGWYCTVR